MATGPTGRVALMSIYPRYAHAILDGIKTVEFRKRRLAEDVTHVVIYSTQPDKAVIGYFTVDGQETLPPSALWQEFRDSGIIDEEDFFRYYEGRKEGTGIRVGNVTRLKYGLSLECDLDMQNPPQSFQYIPRETFEKVLIAS